VNTACHVGNLIFLRAFIERMCYELMHGRAPSLSHFGLLVAASLFSGRVGSISLRQGPLMAFSLVMRIILEHIVCSILKLTKSWKLAR
jgi:hypothetical protein